MPEGFDISQLNQFQSRHNIHQWKEGEPFFYTDAIAFLIEHAKAEWLVGKIFEFQPHVFGATHQTWRMVLNSGCGRLSCWGIDKQDRYYPYDHHFLHMSFQINVLILIAVVDGPSTVLMLPQEE